MIPESHCRQRVALPAVLPASYGEVRPRRLPEAPVSRGQECGTAEETPGYPCGQRCVKANLQPDVRRREAINANQSLPFHNSAIQQINDSMGIARIPFRVCDHNDSRSFFVQLLQQGHHLESIGGVQIAGRFVCQNQRTVRHDGTGNGHPLLFALRSCCGKCPAR